MRNISLLCASYISDFDVCFLVSIEHQKWWFAAIKWGDHGPWWPPTTLYTCSVSKLGILLCQYLRTHCGHSTRECASTCKIGLGKRNSCVWGKCVFYDGRRMEIVLIVERRKGRVAWSKILHTQLILRIQVPSYLLSLKIISVEAIWFIFII